MHARKLTPVKKTTAAKKTVARTFVPQIVKSSEAERFIHSPPAHLKGHFSSAAIAHAVEVVVSKRKK